MDDFPTFLKSDSCIYLMGLNLSNRQISQELELSETDAQYMTDTLR